MIVTFSEVINEVIRGLGLDSETIESRVLESIKLRINEAQDVIFYDSDWEWRKRTFYFTTTPPYETGTISVTQNSRTVTGSGTSWSASMRVGYIVISDKLYKIQSVDSTTSLKLQTPYDGSTASGLEYKIIFPTYPLNHEISSIVAVRYQAREVEPKTKQRLTISPTALAIPSECAMDDRSDEDYYTTGSVAVTNDSTAVTGTGTTWTSEMEGLTFRVNELAKEYTIKSVNSTTSITLKEPYDGNTGSGKSYKINPKGTQLLTFRATPDSYYVMEVEALIKSVRLINNNDVSLIPNHMPLIRHAIWLAMTDLENKNPVRMQQAQSDAARSLKQLRDSYRIITSVRWRSENEQQSRTQYDPLSRLRRY